MLLEFNHVSGHQDNSIPAKLLYHPPQIKFDCDVLEKWLVREEWKYNGSTREELQHEGMICKLSGRKITGDIGKAVCYNRSSKTMEESLAQKGRMKRTTFGLVD